MRPSNNTSILSLHCAIAATFLWMGFVCAISFMEAWIKFKAPGITIPLGLGIGRLVFHALNTMEWIFAGLVLFTLMLYTSEKNKPTWIFGGLSIFILLLQTFWFLPVLDDRALTIIQGETVSASSYRLMYIMLEVFKVCCLFFLGIFLFKNNRYGNKQTLGSY